MFTIIEKTTKPVFRTSTMSHEGIVKAPNGIPTKEEFLTKLDKNNFGGYVNFHKTEEADTYYFYAETYID